MSFFRGGAQINGREQFYDTSEVKGNDFIILIRRKDEYVLGGSFDFAVEKFFDIMTPNSISWRGLSMDSKQWNVEVGNDKINYHWTHEGILMSFSECTSFEKAIKIAKEVSKNLEKHTGFSAILELQPKKRLLLPTRF